MAMVLPTPSFAFYFTPQEKELDFICHYVYNFASTALAKISCLGMCFFYRLSVYRREISFAKENQRSENYGGGRKARKGSDEERV